MFDTLLAHSSIPLYAKDREARYVRKSVVPAGRNPDELIGKTDPEVYTDSPEAAEEWYQDDKEVIRAESGFYDKEECLEASEGEYWSRTTKVPWYEDDQLRGLVGISFDITEYVEYRYRLEEYEQRLEKFTESITHDIRNPLQVAAGNLELARETDDEVALERAAAALDRIEEMLSDLSTLATEQRQTTSRSRIADHSFETVSLTPLGFTELLEDVWEVLETEGATLEYDLPPATTMYAPEEAIRPVLENLLKNAVRHAGPAATVRVGHHPDGGFYVEDDGPGIPPEEREEIFTDGYSTAEDGSGTGLAIVSDIADGQGWNIEVSEGELGGARIDIHNSLFVTTEEMADPVGEAIDLPSQTAVGKLDVECSATFNEESGEWTVIGGGMNIWQSTNEFYFVHAELYGPATIQGRVVDLEDVGQYSKAGLMVRDGVDEGATYGYIGMIPDDRTEVLWRTRSDEPGVSQFVDRDPESTPWFRVDRVGDTITVAVSDDGEGWTPVNERRVELDDPVHLGMVVCSYRPNTTCEAVFDNVTVRRLEPES